VPIYYRTGFTFTDLIIFEQYEFRRYFMQKDLHIFIKPIIIIILFSFFVILPAAARMNDSRNATINNDGIDYSCDGISDWQASTIYVNGDQVIYNQLLYQAKWWTIREEPGTTGEWGVWEDLGVCDNSCDDGNSDNSDSDDDNNNSDDSNSDDDSSDDSSSDDGSSNDNNSDDDTVDNTFPDKVFAPYVDVMLYPTFSLNDTYQQTGQQYYTLAFIISDAACEPAWGGITPLEDNFYMDEINAIRNVGGDVIVSFGGANGTELAMCKSSADELQSAYQAVIDKYNLTWVDFDIEGAAVADQASIDLRNQAIKGLQTANPDLKVAFCLPVLPQGLTDDGLYVLENAIANGVRIDVVNIMAMDYGSWGAPDPEGNMGQYAIDAAENTYSQMQTIGLDAQVGITPMIGQNDVSDERFYLDDASQLYTWASSTDYVSLLSMWSATRDNGDCPGQLSATCSGISQDDFSFIDTFFPFTGND
jgi:chitinase